MGKEKRKEVTNYELFKSNIEAKTPVVFELKFKYTQASKAQRQP